MHEPPPDILELIRGARRVRELIWQDPHRPRFHLVPPEGFFNDPNGALFWNGRYHLFYLAREPIPHPRRPGEEFWVPVWDHVSSRDLVHWIQHPPAIRPKPDGSTPMGIYSGGAIRNAPRPTLIYQVPHQGTCIAVAEDDDLDVWRELPQNPVIPLHGEGNEFVVFDPAGWYEESGPGTYHALIGNKNRRPGYEGDCTSLFTSPDLVHWEYRGPFYRSRREWTLEAEDAACPDFFPIGKESPTGATPRHMLLMHCHRPYRNTTHYYLGSYRDRHFTPEQHGRMSWIGGQLSAPESLIDDRGRNIMFGWMADFRPGAATLYGYERAAEAAPEERNLLAWASVVSLPRVLSLADDGTLAIAPRAGAGDPALQPAPAEGISRTLGVRDDSSGNLGEQPRTVPTDRTPRRDRGGGEGAVRTERQRADRHLLRSGRAKAAGRLPPVQPGEEPGVLGLRRGPRGGLPYHRRGAGRPLPARRRGSPS